MTRATARRQSSFSLLVSIALLFLAGEAVAREVHTLSRDGVRVEIEVTSDRLAAEFGPRFDRTAIVRSVQVDGVELLGPWGMPDEFGLYGDGVLGYAAAGIGETFVKIGVGRLTRDTADDYQFAHPYPVSALFPVAVDADETSLTIEQLSPGAGSYAYRYRKSYRLLDSERLVINYELSNTGASAWTFEHYNHHWFRMAGTPVGPGYGVSTGFELPEATTAFHRGLFTLDMPAPLAEGEAVYYASDLAEVPPGANTFAWAVDGVPVVGYQGSFAPARFALYASADGFCPEVFKRAILAPGATITWSATYRFTKP